MRAVALRAGAQEDPVAATLLRLAFAEAADAYPTLGGYAAARVHAGWLERRRADYDPIVWERLDTGRRRTHDELRDAHRNAIKCGGLTAIVNQYIWELALLREGDQHESVGLISWDPSRKHADMEKYQSSTPDHQAFTSIELFFFSELE